ncbi:MAG TPA: NAD(P)/FAD-dependent oxidoreductase [Solirubrobacteraceae bacterium]|jgi:cation diffusion facilitator CzcD-associated flavoprotein CzcO|nr:NAD(P)/FAD-dependent oxidoreductase [Solirubrobacteraceae bacterium]
MPTSDASQNLRRPDEPTDVDTVIVGSGFSGLAMAVALKRAGREDFLILERAHDVGGTWRENSYPGCACDVPSHLYSLSFAPNPDWTSTFSPQPEIQAYLQRVADEHRLLPHVRFGCELERAWWDEPAQRWHLETAQGPLTARVLIAAPGPLSEPAIPDLPGLENFEGTVFHSATWDHEHDLTNERVAVIGTGASSIQFVPQIQPAVSKLHLFQRTAPWIMPRPDRPLTRFERLLYRRLPVAQRVMREIIYRGRELYALPMLRAALAPAIAVVARRHLRRQVHDPGLRQKLTPSYAPGCKRILVSNDYLPSLSKPNVEVVTDGIGEIGPRSIISKDGTERAVDTIIFGTGFHVTDTPIANRVQGRDGRTLAEHWDGSLSAHRGTTVAGFPNLFFMLGPNTGVGHTSVVVMAEAQVGYVMRALDHMDAAHIETIEPRPDAQRAWNDEVQRRMQGTVWIAGGCKSWYLDSKGLNTTLWPDFTFRFRHALTRFDPGEYWPGRPAARPAAADTGARATAQVPA